MVVSKSTVRRIRITPNPTTIAETISNRLLAEWNEGDIIDFGLEVRSCTHEGRRFVADTLRNAEWTVDWGYKASGAFYFNVS